MLYFGLLFMAIVLFRPEGIAGAASAVLQRHSLGSIRKQGSSAMRLLFGGERWR
jgi:branched-chain amino acid transport system permease protein